MDIPVHSADAWRKARRKTLFFSSHRQGGQECPPPLGQTLLVPIPSCICIFHIHLRVNFEMRSPGSTIEMTLTESSGHVRFP